MTQRYRAIIFALAATMWMGLLEERPTGQTLPRVLYLTHSAGFAHSVLPFSEEVLLALGRSDNAFHIDITRDAAILTADVLSRYDVVVFFTTGELPLNPQQQEDFLAFIRSGGGFVGIHSATDTFYDWSAYGELLGGYFDNHPWRQNVTVKVENPAHPITKHLSESFRISDEIYQFKNWTRENVNVLLSLDISSVDVDSPQVHRTDNDFALAWTKSYGAGRMFYTALGHEEVVWRDDRFQKLVVNGILWAAGKPQTLATGDKWQLLFDGETTQGWRGYKRDTIPNGWQAINGTLTRVSQAGDILTTGKYENFELSFEWRLESKGNSGVFFRVSEEGAVVWHSGPEFQLLHNAGHRDGNDPITSAGSNYAIHPPVADVTRPIGTWNTSRLIVNQGQVEHWMNGFHLLSYEINSPDWQERVNASKFVDLPLYGQTPSGHIGIQDHGDPVSFRNVMIRVID